MSRAFKTDEERAATPSFVACCATCGNIVACSVDEPEYKKDNANHVAGWIRSGLKVSTLTVAEVRKAAWCSCERKKKSKAEAHQ